MALDQAPSNGSERERLARLITQKLEHGTDQEVGGLLKQLTNSSSGQQRRGDQVQLGDLPDRAKELRTGEDDEDDPRIAKLKEFLSSKGLRGLDLQTACDLAARSWRGDDLGIGPSGSAKFGGASTGKNFGGALSEGIAQRSSQSYSDNPAARDLAGLCAEEQMGIEPVKDRGRGIGRDSRMSFDEVFGLFGPGGVFESPPRTRQMALDEARRAASSDDSFFKMFPDARRIRPAW
jgi:hypothetical protein